MWAATLLPIPNEARLKVGPATTPKGAPPKPAARRPTGARRTNARPAGGRTGGRGRIRRTTSPCPGKCKTAGHCTARTGAAERAERPALASGSGTCS